MPRSARVSDSGYTWRCVCCVGLTHTDCIYSGCIYSLEMCVLWKRTYLKNIFFKNSLNSNSFSVLQLMSVVNFPNQDECFFSNWNSVLLEDCDHVRKLGSSATSLVSLSCLVGGGGCISLSTLSEANFIFLCLPWENPKSENPSRPIRPSLYRWEDAE